MKNHAQLLEAVLGLLRMVHPGNARTGARTTQRGQWHGLDDLDWHAFVAFTSGHFVLPALAGPLAEIAGCRTIPADLIDFSSEIAAANAKRNAGLETALFAIAKHLNASGIEPIALKGAAFLLDRHDPVPQGWRFMGDLDLLVPEQALDECVRVVRGLGYLPAKAKYDATIEAHYPPLVSPCGTFSVELHTRLFGLSDFGLPARTIVRESRLAQNNPARVRQPSPTHRIAQVIGHAQLHNRNFVARRLVLKDLLDLSMLPRKNVDEFERNDLEAIFSEQPHQIAAKGLMAAWHMAIDESPRRPLPQRANRWAKTAMRRLAWPPWRKIASAAADVARMELHRVFRERGHLARRARLVLDPELLRDNGRAWAFKQRQKLWS